MQSRADYAKNTLTRYLPNKQQESAYGGMVGLHVIEYLLRVPWVWGFPWGFQWGFLWVWDGYGD